MTSAYVDNKAARNLLCCIYNNPILLEPDGKHFYDASDFCLDFYSILLGAFQRLYLNHGVKNLTVPLIEDLLKDYPESYATFKQYNGPQWLKDAEEFANDDGFEYYYMRVKKFALLRQYEATGLNVTEIYDPNLLDIAEKEKQEHRFDEITLDAIAATFETKLEMIHQQCIDGSMDESSLLGEGLKDVILKPDEIDFGVEMFGKYVNTLTCGMRLGGLFLRSAATGVGKTRSMIADATFCATGEYYDPVDGWVKRHSGYPVLFIATEQEKREIQRMAVAFIANVDESHIYSNTCTDEEKERVLRGIEILEQSKFYVECIPDFSTQDIENCIRRHLVHPEKQVQHVFFDYIHSSMKIMSEITQNARGLAMREDQILSLFSIKLKEIATKYKVFILTSTQLNGEWKQAKEPDQNLLRGAKAIADKADFGCILMDVTDEDEEDLKEIVQNLGCEMPNVKMAVYKNRRGKYTKGYLWMKANKATCRFSGLFWTDYYFKHESIRDNVIELRQQVESAWSNDV